MAEMQTQTVSIPFRQAIGGQWAGPYVSPKMIATAYPSSSLTEEQRMIAAGYTRVSGPVAGKPWIGATWQKVVPSEVRGLGPTTIIKEATQPLAQEVKTSPVQPPLSQEVKPAPTSPSIAAGTQVGVGSTVTDIATGQKLLKTEAGFVPAKVEAVKVSEIKPLAGAPAAPSFASGAIPVAEHFRGGDRIVTFVNAEGTRTFDYNVRTGQSFGGGSASYLQFKPVDEKAPAVSSFERAQEPLGAFLQSQAKMRAAQQSLGELKPQERVFFEGLLGVKSPSYREMVGAQIKSEKEALSVPAAAMARAQQPSQEAVIARLSAESEGNRLALENLGSFETMPKAPLLAVGAVVGGLAVGAVKGTVAGLAFVPKAVLRPVDAGKELFEGVVGFPQALAENPPQAIGSFFGFGKGLKVGVKGLKVMAKPFEPVVSFGVEKIAPMAKPLEIFKPTITEPVMAQYIKITERLNEKAQVNLKRELVQVKPPKTELIFSDGSLVPVFPQSISYGFKTAKGTLETPSWQHTTEVFTRPESIFEPSRLAKSGGTVEILIAQQKFPTQIKAVQDLFGREVRTTSKGVIEAERLLKPVSSMVLGKGEVGFNFKVVASQQSFFINPKVEAPFLAAKKVFGGIKYTLIGGLKPLELPVVPISGAGLARELIAEKKRGYSAFVSEGSRGSIIRGVDLKEREIPKTPAQLAMYSFGEPNILRISSKAKVFDIAFSRIEPYTYGRDIARGIREVRAGAFGPQRYKSVIKSTPTIKDVFVVVEDYTNYAKNFDAVSGERILTNFESEMRNRGVEPTFGIGEEFRFAKEQYAQAQRQVVRAMSGGIAVPQLTAMQARGMAAFSVPSVFELPTPYSFKSIKQVMQQSQEVESNIVFAPVFKPVSVLEQKVETAQRPAFSVEVKPILAPKVVSRDLLKEVVSFPTKEVGRFSAREASRELNRLADKVVERDVEKLLQREAQREVSREVERDLQRNVEREVQRNVQREVQRNVQREVQRNVQRNVQREVQRNIQRNIQRDILREIPAAPSRFALPSQIQRLALKVKPLIGKAKRLPRPAPIADLVLKTQTELATMSRASSPRIKTALKYFRAGLRIPTSEMLKSKEKQFFKRLK